MTVEARTTPLAGLWFEWTENLSYTSAPERFLKISKRLLNLMSSVRTSNQEVQIQ